MNTSNSQALNNPQDTVKPSVLVLCLMFAFCIWDQSAFWLMHADYKFGFLMPIFALYVILERLEQLKAHLSQSNPQPSKIWLLLGVLSLATFTFGALMRAGIGVIHTASFLLWIGLIGCVCTFIGLHCLHAKECLKLLTFPLLVGFISVPMFLPIEIPIKLFLMKKIAAGVAFFMDILGYPVIQEGNLLVMPMGKVGIEEACSGMRSLVGSLFVGSFLAAVCARNLFQKLTTIFLAIAIAFIGNFCRSLFLTFWVYNNPKSPLPLWVHDLSGYLVLVLTALALILISKRFSPNANT